ncbi:MAG: hypothetical protein ABI282_11600, partial [Candidatus Baltobacteraceae bacterium]
SSVKSAYNLLVSGTVLTTMIPFFFLFASAIKLYAEPSNLEMVRIPGGRVTVVTAAVIGLATTLIAAVLAVFPADDDPNKPLAVIKLLVLTVLVIGPGIAIYFAGRRRALQTARE